MRIKRILAVTAGLAVAGGVFGTIAGALTLLAWLIWIGQLHSLVDDTAFVLWIGAWYGGTLGAVMGPIAAWLLMRHVPLGLAVGGTLLGTLASGGMGLLATGNPVVAMLWGMAGFGITAIGLRIRFPSRERRLLRG
jgi:hypothetical protein